MKHQASAPYGILDDPLTEVEEAVDRITKTILGAGLLVGTTAQTGARAKELMAKGHRIVLHNVTALLRNGAAAYFAGVR